MAKDEDELERKASEIIEDYMRAWCIQAPHRSKIAACADELIRLVQEGS